MKTTVYDYSTVTWEDLNQSVAYKYLAIAQHRTDNSSARVYSDPFSGVDTWDLEWRYLGKRKFIEVLAMAPYLRITPADRVFLEALKNKMRKGELT